MKGGYAEARWGDTGERLTEGLTMPPGTAETTVVPPIVAPPGPPTAEQAAGRTPALAVFEEGGRRQASSAATVDMLFEAHVDSVLVDWAGLMEPAEDAPPPLTEGTMALELLLQPATAEVGGCGCGL